jgi:hypothetical protein
MSPFHVNYRARLAEVTAALHAARAAKRHDEALALELAALVLERHLGDLDRSRLALA